VLDPVQFVVLHLQLDLVDLQLVHQFPHVGGRRGADLRRRFPQQHLRLLTQSSHPL